MKIKSIIIVACTLWCNCFSFASDNPFKDYRITTKNLLEIFPDAVELNIIFQVYEDSRGFTWIATENGLIRYDGYKLKYFLHDDKNKSSIGHYQIKCISEDSSHILWIGLFRNGIDCYNPVTEKFTHYPFDKSGKNPLTAKVVFIDKSNTVWFITSDNHLAKLDKSTGNYQFYEVVDASNTKHALPLTPDRYNRALASIVESDEQSLWITSVFGLYHFDKATGKSIAFYTPGPKKELPIFSTGHAVILGDNIWMGSWSSGLRRFNIKTNEWKVYLFSPLADLNYADNILNRIAIKNDNELWLAANDRGLGTFNIQTEQFYFFSDHPETYPELQFFPCYNVFEDSRKNVWVKFDNKLMLLKITERFVYRVLLPAKRKDNRGMYYPTDILEESTGRYLLIGSIFADGLYIQERKTGIFESYDFPISLKGENSMKVCKLIEIKGSRVWVITRDRILLFDLNKKKWIPVKEPPLFGNAVNSGSNNYIDATMDVDSNLWISIDVNGNQGLIFYNTKNQEAKYISPTQVKNAKYFGKIRRLYCDKHNRIWFRNRAERAAGYYDINSNTEHTFDENGNEANESVGTISLTDGKNGNMLLASDVALLIYDSNGEKPKLKSKLTASSGLKSDMIENQAEDNFGNIWYSCNDAIYRYNPSNKKNELFDLHDVLVNDKSTIKCGNDSLIYLMARHGYNQINVNSIHNDSTFSNLKLTDLQIDGKNISFESEFVNKKQITIPANYSYILFEFANLDIAHSENINYSYKLEGFDDEWINSGQRRTASYTNLPGGKYSLKVRCALGNNEWNKTILEIPIYIETIFYKSMWFRLCAMILLASLMYLIYRYRTNQQRAIDELNNRAQLLEKEKSVVHYENLKQQLNPHFLFNSLTSLSSLISTEPKIARQFVEQMSKIYRYILKSNEHETVALINEINFATTYVKLQQTRFQQGFEVNFNIGEEFNDRKIVPVTIQNMIENAIKHNIIDEESPLVIDIYVEDDYLVVKNNLQRKGVVESSNKVGLEKMKTLYKYLIDKPIVIEENANYFSIKIPLI